MAEKKFKATIEIGGAVAGSLKTSFAAVTGRTKVLGAAIRGLKSQMKETRAEMKKSGADTARLGQQLAMLERKASATKRVLAGYTRLGDLSLGNRIGSVGRNLALVGAGATAAAAGLGALFKTQFLDVAAQFEKFQTILETIEGSSEKANASFQWISDFAAKTPYDLATVTQAFVKLKAYGIDPIDRGMLKTLGDTAAAMGKDVMDAVEAVADAITGENERLKEFGIKATKENGRILYRFTDKNGKEIVAAADANNRKQIQGTLQAIWNEKYGGAMEKMSGTWEGMMSNLGDQWTRFTSLVMQSSAFENLKNRLGSLLATIDRMAADGSLQKLASEMGTAISKTIDSLADFAAKVPGWTKSFLQFMEPFGGLKTVLIAIAAVPLLPLIASIISLGSALVMALPAVVSITTGLWGMAAAAAGGTAALLPIIGTAALVVAGIAALGYAVWHVIENWDTWKWAIDELWGKLSSFGTSVVEWVGTTSAAFADFGTGIYDSIVGAFDSVTAKVSAWFDWIKGKLSSVGSSISGLFGGGDTATPDGARAKGGPVRRGGSYLVGEQGPELFTPGASGSIIPNNRLGGSQSVDSRTYNITINAAPGMDERSLADLVLARLDGRQAALAGGALYD